MFSNSRLSVKYVLLILCFSAQIQCNESFGEDEGVGGGGWRTVRVELKTNS